MRRLKRLWLALLLASAAAAQTIPLAPANPSSAGTVGNAICITATTNGIVTLGPCGFESVTSSTTPTFSTAVEMSIMTLTGNVTTFTLGSGAGGQVKTICWLQGAGAYTVVPPSNVKGFTPPGTTAGTRTCQDFRFDPTDSLWLAPTPGVQNQ